MSRRLVQYLILSLLSGVLSLAQFSLISALPWPWSNANLVVVAVIFAFLVLGRDRAWFLALTAGWFLDVWSFHPFGLSMLSLLASAVIVHLVLENWLTNRSLYSFLLLTVIAISADALIYNILSTILDWSGSSAQFFLISGAFWEFLIWSILLGAVIVGLFFNLLAVVSRRLQPFFLKDR